MKALILAAGRGSRLNEFTKNKNKSMIKLFEKPLIEYNLEHAYEAGVSEIIIVVGYEKEKIIRYVGSEYRGIKVSYVIQKEQKGLVHAIESAKEAIGKSDFFLMLGDEILLNTRIKSMVKKFRGGKYVVCGIIYEKDRESISKTYSVMVNGEKIYRLIEKPRFPINNIKGTGHCIMKNDILEHIERTPINMNRGEKEMVDMIQLAIDEGKDVEIFNIADKYVNVNTEGDLKLIEEIIKKKNPKILIVHPQMKFIGGAELLIIELANWLTKKGIKNDILTLSSSLEIRNKLFNTNIIEIKNNLDISPPGFKSPRDLFKAINLFRKNLRKIENDYDVINFHNFPSTWASSNKPSLWMLNEPPNLWSKPNAGRLLKFSNYIRNFVDKIIVKDIDMICVADEFNKKRAFERYGRNSKIVYYGVNHEFFSRGNKNRAIKKFNLKDRFVIIQSGVLNENKNQIDSLKAIEQIKDKIPEVLIILAGKGEEEYTKILEKYVEINNLEGNVLFVGNLDRNDLRDLYAACNLGLFPVKKQGGWLAPFELLCSGNPIIVSKNMGAASVIDKFNLGIVSNKYSEKIIEIYEDYQTYKTKSEIASLFIKKNFGWNVFTDKLIKNFKKISKKN